MEKTEEREFFRAIPVNFHHPAKNDISRSISHFSFFLFFLSVFLPRLRTRSTFLIAHHGHCRISTCFTTLFTLLSPPPRLCPIFRETTERNRRFGHCFVFEINTYIYIYITLPSNFLLF